MTLKNPPSSYVPKATELRSGARFYGKTGSASGQILSVQTAVFPTGVVGADSNDATTRYARITGTSIGATSVGYADGDVDYRHDPLVEVVQKLPATLDPARFLAQCVAIGVSTTINGVQPPGVTFARLRLNPYDPASPGPLQLSAQLNGAGLVTSSKFGGIAVAANEWHKLRLRVSTADKRIYGSIDDGAEASLDCSSIPGLFTGTTRYRFIHYAEWTGSSSAAEYNISTVYCESRAR